MKAPARPRRRKGARARPQRDSVVRVASDQDARDLAIMRLELRASRRAEGSIVDADITAQRHLTNVAAQWIITRDRKHTEAEAQGKNFDEARFLKRQLNISTSTMRRWIIILRPLVRVRAKAPSRGWNWVYRRRLCSCVDRGRNL
jgi:hypothetical protein